ncbi:MAG: putative two-component response regulator protein [Hyphomicrobiales bacterium]|jgi:CRP-like cAMP-binding protein|nr:putative two-component response regulator protein [Hyphomicrobiales bacterium]
MAYSIQNQLLRRLTGRDFEALKPCLKPVTLADRQLLSGPGEIIREVYFIESGVCSVKACVSDSDSIEVGLIGREGVTDHVMEMGDSSALSVLVQIPGEALCVHAEAYANWIRGCDNALRLMVRYQQAWVTQISFTALAHGSFNVEERLARLLLMLFDRVDETPIPLPHDRLALMLSVRRSGVTNALHVLEGLGAIKSNRSQVILRDRPLLETLTSGSYGIAEAEYARLLGPMPPR